jgi:hypothetical protein
MSLVETDIGTIAPDWKVVPLKDVAEKPQYGLTAKAAKSGDTKFLRITDITDQGVNWATGVCDINGDQAARRFSQ